MKLSFHHIGLRIVKSSVGVLLCYIVSYLRVLTGLPPGLPFYSMLAVLQCMQPYTDKTVSIAIQRGTGTLVGAFYGLVTILTEIYVFSIYNSMWGYIVNGLMIIPVIYTTVVFNKKNASYFSCVVFLSIVVNHIADANPFMFVLDRVLDTFIGIAIGILVNRARLPRRKVLDRLFIADMDDMLEPVTEEPAAFSRVELNRMLDDGLNFTVVTMRTPASLMKPLSDIHLKLPAVVMNGAALYDIKENTYVKAYIISNNTCEKVREKLREAGMNCFTNALRGDRLMIYYDKLENEPEKKIYKSLRKSPYRAYVNLPAPPEDKTIYLMAIAETERVKAFCEEFAASGLGKGLKLVSYPSDDYKGFSYIKIYNKNADSRRMVEYLLDEYKLSADDVIKADKPASGKRNLNAVVRTLKKRFEPFILQKSDKSAGNQRADKH